MVRSIRCMSVCALLRPFARNSFTDTGVYMSGDEGRQRLSFLIQSTILVTSSSFLPHAYLEQGSGSFFHVQILVHLLVLQLKPANAAKAHLRFRATGLLYRSCWAGSQSVVAWMFVVCESIRIALHSGSSCSVWTQHAKGHICSSYRVLSSHCMVYLIPN